MKTFCLVLLGFLCCGGAIAVGCGDDDGSAGTAPAISNLTHDATTLTVGTQGVINGSFAFSDPEGDVEIMEIDLVMPNGQPGVVPNTVLSNVDGIMAGSVNWNLSLTPPQAGTYDLVIRVVDMEGNVSNELQETFEAQ